MFIIIYGSLWLLLWNKFFNISTSIIQWWDNSFLSGSWFQMFLKLYTLLLMCIWLNFIPNHIILSVLLIRVLLENRSNQECIHQTPIMTISTSAELTKHLSWYLFSIPASFSYTRQMPFQSSILYVQNAPWVVENMVGNTPYLKTTFWK